MIKFLDDTQVGLIGLDHIMAELYNESREANDETVEEMLRRLEEKNYIPPYGKVRKDYAFALLNEYRKYVKTHKEKNKST
jgi:predicted transcriptional regulator